MRPLSRPLSAITEDLTKYSGPAANFELIRQTKGCTRKFDPWLY